MKRSSLIALAVTAGIAAAAVSTSGCSTTTTGAPATATPRSATAPSAIRPPHPVTYAPQVELPFGKLINHLAGVAVDAANNVYVLDLYYGQVWEMAAGTNNLEPLAFKDLG
ncbi:MAG: hypothetical protein JWP83_5875, partial [Mycobacterium sp.]|nr:hypothetical protein [Mycobacterium sp.]